MRVGLNRLSALNAAAFGVPGFFSPRIPPAIFALDGTPGALSVYDTAPLRNTLEDLVDFDYLNREERVRLSVGSVNVHTGNSIYFDNRERKLGADHIMASGSLPPGLPPITIDGEHYWDGGIVSNSPLSHVLDDSPELSALIVQVDLFSAKGELPVNLDQVLEREKDIRYSSKTRFNTKRVQELENMRRALGRLMRKLPARAPRRPRLQAIAAVVRRAAPDHDRPSDQSAVRSFDEFEGLRILPHDGATALGSRARRRAARLRPSRVAPGDRARARRAGVRSVGLTSSDKRTRA